MHVMISDSNLRCTKDTFNSLKYNIAHVLTKSSMQYDRPHEHVGNYHISITGRDVSKVKVDDESMTIPRVTSECCNEFIMF